MHQTTDASHTGTPSVVAASLTAIITVDRRKPNTAAASRQPRESRRQHATNLAPAAAAARRTDATSNEPTLSLESSIVAYPRDLLIFEVEIISASFNFFSCRKKI